VGARSRLFVRERVVEPVVLHKQGGRPSVKPVTLRADSTGVRRIAGLLVASVVVAGCFGGAPPGPPPPPPPHFDADNVDANNPYGWFEAGKAWSGDFADPHVVVVNGTYVAYATPAGGRYLPMTASTDLVNWVAHPRWTSAPPPWQGSNPETDPAIPIEIRRASMNPVDTWNLNDALVAPPAWAQQHDQGAWLKKDLWAPGVTKIGSSWYAYSAVKVSDHSDDPIGLGRWCITVASAPSHLGPFRDISGAGPIVCDTDPAGSIDPSPFYDVATGTHYLLWKAAGRVGVSPSALKSVRLGSNGLPTGGWTTLLTTNHGSWEGSTIENPSMAFFGGTHYLFYSGGNYAATSNGSSTYATGYATCPSGPRGPCTRAATRPLLASSGHVQGPGGASAFVDTSGNLRLAHHYYWLGENRGGPVAHPRRLRVVRLHRNPNGTLAVA
jgi:hypothetical protein